MKPEIDVTIYNASEGGGAPELWHADKWPQGAHGEIDVAQAKQGFPITARITRGDDTSTLHLTLDEALELRDALDMARHRCYEPSQALIAKLRAGETPTVDELGRELQLFELSVASGLDGGLSGAGAEPKRKDWKARKVDVLVNVIRRRAGL